MLLKILYLYVYVCVSGCGMLRWYAEEIFPCQVLLFPHHNRILQASNCAKACQLNRAEPQEAQGNSLKLS